MKKKNVFLGRFLMLLGSLFVIAALLLFAYNQQQQRMAARTSNEILSQVLQTIKKNTAMPQSKTEQSILEDSGYLGVLELPDLEMTLPIQTDWSYDKLKSTPCVYSGSIKERNLVLLGHNYRSHFGPLDRLRPGNQIVLIDAVGTRFEYEVKELVVLDAAKIDDMVDSGYDLSLFTCNYDGKARITVRCSLQNPSDYFLKSK